MLIIVIIIIIIIIIIVMLFGEWTRGLKEPCITWGPDHSTGMVTYGLRWIFPILHTVPKSAP